MPISILLNAELHFLRQTWIVRSTLYKFLVQVKLCAKEIELLFFVLHSCDIWFGSENRDR